MTNSLETVDLWDGSDWEGWKPQARRPWLDEPEAGVIYGHMAGSEPGDPYMPIPGGAGSRLQPICEPVESDCVLRCAVCGERHLQSTMVQREVERRVYHVGRVDETATYQDWTCRACPQRTCGSPQLKALQTERAQTAAFLVFGPSPTRQIDTECHGKFTVNPAARSAIRAGATSPLYAAALGRSMGAQLQTRAEERRQALAREVEEADKEWLRATEARRLAKAARTAAALVASLPTERVAPKRSLAEYAATAEDVDWDQILDVTSDGSLRRIGGRPVFVR